MRTSNKILLILFMAGIITITAVYLALYIKYRSGNYVPMDQADKNHFASHILRGVNYVSVTGMEKITIVPADTDKTKLEVEQEDDNRLQFQIVHDTLFINGDSSASRQEFEKGLRNFEPVILYLPNPGNIVASFSRIRISGSKDPAIAPTFDVKLIDHSDILPKEFNTRIVGGGYFSRINISAGLNSDILLSPTFNIKELNVVLEGTGFSDGGATIDSINVIADKNSIIKLTGINFTKANTTLKK